MELGMKEPYTEGLAIHCGPEPCGGVREDAAEALDRGKRRPGIGLRNHHSGVPTLLPEREGHTMCSVKRELPTDPAESKTLSMRGNSMHENREIPYVPVGVCRWVGRGRRKPHVRHVRIWEVGQSHSTDEASEQRRWRHRPAEEVEGRGLTKGNS